MPRSNPPDSRSEVPVTKKTKVLYWYQLGLQGEAYGSAVIFAKALKENNDLKLNEQYLDSLIQLIEDEVSKFFLLLQNQGCQ